MTLKSHCEVTIWTRVHLCALERGEVYETKLSVFVKCRVIGLQVTSKRGAPPVTPWRSLQIGETCFGNVLGAISSGRAMCCFEAVVGRRELPQSKRGNESGSEDTD